MRRKDIFYIMTQQERHEFTHISERVNNISSDISNLSYCRRAKGSPDENFLGLLARELIALKVAEYYDDGIIAVQAEIALETKVEHDDLSKPDSFLLRARNCARRLVAGQCELYTLFWQGVQYDETGELLFEFSLLPKEEV